MSPNIRDMAVARTRSQVERGGLRSIWTAWMFAYNYQTRSTFPTKSSGRTGALETRQIQGPGNKLMPCYKAVTIWRPEFFEHFLKHLRCELKASAIGAKFAPLRSTIRGSYFVERGTTTALSSTSVAMNVYLPGRIIDRRCALGESSAQSLRCACPQFTTSISLMVNCTFVSATTNGRCSTSLSPRKRS